MATRVFVTGGAGFIGSHTVLALLRAQFEVHVFDNFANSSPRALRRVRELTGAPIAVTEGDVTDPRALAAALKAYSPDAVIHFAGLKAVGDSEEDPLSYFTTNVQGTVNLLRAMDECGCGRIVFSSSATVYGDPVYLPYDESHPIAPMNPYGRTKAYAEGVIEDWVRANPGNGALLLRYFNPVGADESGRIGEDPSGRPNNLMPFIAQVAIGRRQMLRIFGGDYPTRDGTGERDYIHVTDLARAHLRALDRVLDHPGCEAVNVGSGQGVTVLEMIRAFEIASGREIAYRIVDRRPGDLASYYAGPDKARSLLGWETQLGVEDMCASTWKWQSDNPNGYRDGRNSRAAANIVAAATMMDGPAGLSITNDRPSPPSTEASPNRAASATIASGLRAKGRAAAAGMIRSPEIKSAPTILSASATVSARSPVRSAVSRCGSIPPARARSSPSVAVSSAFHRAATSPATTTPAPQMIQMSSWRTARMSPNSNPSKSIRGPGASATPTNPMASIEWLRTPKIVSALVPLRVSPNSSAPNAAVIATTPTVIGSDRMTASATPSTAAWPVASPK